MVSAVMATFYLRFVEMSLEQADRDAPKTLCAGESKYESKSAVNKQIKKALSALKSSRIMSILIPNRTLIIPIFMLTMLKLLMLLYVAACLLTDVRPTLMPKINF